MLETTSLIELVGARAILRTARSLKSEPPFTVQEATASRELEDSWQPVYRELKGRLASAIDFTEKRLKVEPEKVAADPWLLLDDEIEERVESAWNGVRSDYQAVLWSAHDAAFSTAGEVKKAETEREALEELAMEELAIQTAYYYKASIASTIRPNVQATIRKLAREIDGLDDAEVARFIDRLDELLRNGDYLETLAGVNVSRSYQFGFLDWCTAHGVVTYEWRGYPDFRMCEICASLDGTSFDVNVTVEAKDRFARLGGDVEAAKDVFPWPTVSQIREMSKAQLAASAYRLPPIHPSCRCWVVPVGTMMG